jgi:choline dehydrogenase-like flavoprotein
MDTFDVCVIGSGPAGAFAANILARNGCSVAVVEAGDSAVDSDASHVLDESASEIGGRSEFGFSRQVGGSSNLWAGFIAPLNGIDFLARPDLGVPGWPITESDLQRHYARVDQFMGLERASRENPSDVELACSDLQAHATIQLDPPFVTTALVRGIGGLRLLDRCAVHRLIWSEEQVSVRAVEYLHKPTGELGRLQARAFVVAAGTLANVTILLHSLADRGDRLAGLRKRIGAGFSTHPKATAGSVTLKKMLPWHHPFTRINWGATHTERYQFGLKKEVLLEKGLLNHCVRFDPPFQAQVQRVVDAGRRAVLRLPFVGKERVARLTRRALSAIEKVMPPTPNRELRLRLFLDQAPQPKNRVTLSSRRSESGLPLAAIHWQYSDADWLNVEAFLHEVSRVLNQAGIGTLRFERPTHDRLVALHSHFLGGTPMGASRESSVVNADLRVHEVDNLYVSGPSVFPSYGYANPFYTIAALSVRLGEHLTRVLKARAAA